MKESNDSPGCQGDQYSRVEYRRLIAWGPRIEREGPFLLRLLDGAPDPSVVDLGCGTGEHVAFFAETGVRALGVDRSEAMVAAARDHEDQGHGRFICADAREADRALAEEPHFGMAICLGNMLPHLQEPEDLNALLASTQALLRPGGRFLVQLLNYRRIREQGIRQLPINFRPGEDGRETVFVRLMTHQRDGRVLFYPTSLELDPESDPPVTVRASKKVSLRAWTDAELRLQFEGHGFEIQLMGDMQGGPYEPFESTDLVIQAIRSS